MPKVVSYFSQELFKKRKGEIPPGWDFDFATDTEEEAIIKACQGADYLLVTAANPTITANVIQNINSIRHLQVFGAGFDKIDLEAARKVNLPVANTPGQNATTVAEFTIAMIVLLQRKIFVANREVKAGKHAEIEREFIMGNYREIRGSKVGLLGLGAIGKLVAQLLKIMGASVCYYDIFRPDKSVEEELSLTYCSFEDVLKNSDIVSLHLPLNNDTRDIISTKEFAMMKPGAILINTARGEIVDQIALAEALESGRLGGAGIDHFGAVVKHYGAVDGQSSTPAPEPDQHPLLTMSQDANDRFIATSHIAGVTAPSFERMLKESLDNLLRVEAGDDPKYVVNGVSKIRK